eukprot:TRINITY_DN7024_c0_g1_i15.p1 TRINITY_DN7024_c0_g1~~TRINITY_DN7024_c0_g1_i15.p1  ORF type:complete len:578 (+),score=126.78 TRINITY_DN7024_c0_g1_i15:64-1797(+)
MNSVRRGGDRAHSSLGLTSHRTSQPDAMFSQPPSFRAASSRGSPDLFSLPPPFSPAGSFRSASASPHPSQPLLGSQHPSAIPRSASFNKRPPPRKIVDESKALTGNRAAQRLFDTLEDLANSLRMCPLIMPELLLSSSQIMTQGPEFCLDEWDDHIYACKEVQRILVTSKGLHPRGNADKGNRPDRAKFLDSSDKKVMRRFRHSTRDLCRAFVNSPTEAKSTLDSLRQLQTMRSSASVQPGESIIHLAEQVMELRDVCYERLTTTYEEDEMQYLKIQDANTRIDQLKVELGILQQEFNKRKEERQEKLDQRLHTVSSMRDELAHIESRIQQSKAAPERNVSPTRDTLAIKNVQTQIQSMNIELAAAESEAQQKITVQRRAVETVKREIAEWIQKYDRDMLDKHTLLEQLTVDVDVQQKELETLQADLDELQDICKSLEREEWLINLPNDPIANKAAVKIQMWWRFQQQKRRLALLQKKTRKKKGKGRNYSQQGSTSKKSGNVNRIAALSKKTAVATPSTAATLTPSLPVSTPNFGDRSSLHSAGSSFVTSGGQISPRSQVQSPDPNSIYAQMRMKTK